MITILACLVMAKALASPNNLDGGIQQKASLKICTAFDATNKYSGDRVTSAVRSRVAAALKLNPFHPFFNRDYAKIIWLTFKRAVGTLYRTALIEPLRNFRNIHGSLKSARVERSNLKVQKKTKENGNEMSKSAPPTLLLQPPKAILTSTSGPSTPETTAEIGGSDTISIFLPSIASSHVAVIKTISLPILKQTVESNYATFKESHSSKLNNLYLLVILLVVVGGGVYFFYVDYDHLQIKLHSHDEKLHLDGSKALEVRELSVESDDSEADLFPKNEKVLSFIDESVMSDSIFKDYHDRTEAKESYDESDFSTDYLGMSAKTKCPNSDAQNTDHIYAELRQKASDIKYENDAMPTGSATEFPTANLAECESFDVMTLFDSLSDSVSTATSTNVSPSHTSDRHVNVKTFTCSCPFDQNGVISYLTSFAGVHKGKSCSVRAKMSSIFLGSEMTILTQSLEHPGLHSFPNYTQNEANSWCAIDLGSGRRLMPTQYCIRHGASSTGNALRSWELRGREKENEEWDVIKAHVNDDTLSSTPMSVALWDIEQKNFKKRKDELETEINVIGDAARGALKAYRYFLLLQTAVNSSGNHCLFVGGMELYGVLTEK